MFSIWTRSRLQKEVVEKMEIENEEALYELSVMTQKILRELSIASVLCPLESMRIIKLETQIAQLTERIKLLEEEMNSTKRKRWCKWCLEEAIYQSKNSQFYCCSKCEQLDILWSES